MLAPRKIRRRKQHLLRLRKKAKGGTEVVFGDYGLKALRGCYMTARQIEAARVAMTRHMKRTGKVWIKVFPDQSVSKKPAETRMGSGKGSPETWVARVERGRVVFEVGGVDRGTAEQALRLAAQKLPVKTALVERLP